MRVTVNGAKIWFDVSGPSVIVADGKVLTRPTVVSVHGGPGLDHLGLKNNLGVLANDAQVLFYDQRGHGRSDLCTAADWNLATWATDLHDLCDTLGIDRPIVLGSSFGGFVALAYAAMFPGHPGGVVLSNTTGGRSDHARSVEIFRRIGGDKAAAVAARDFAEISAESAKAFDEVCYPLYSAAPGFAEEAAERMRLATHTTEVNLHYFKNEAPSFDAWTLLPDVTCPILVIAGADDPICPIELVEDMAAGLINAASVEFLRLPGARHAVFRDRPDLVFPALLEFARTHSRPGGQVTPS